MSPNRTDTMQRAAHLWKQQLVDISGRNRLLNYRDLKAGTLDLTPQSARGISLSALESLLLGRTVKMSLLFPDEESSDDARRRLSAIHRRTQEHLDEKGINTLFAVVGLATWDVDTGTRPNAPVILIPMSISPADAARWDFDMEVSGDAHLNPVLAHVLQSQFGVGAYDIDDELAEGLPASFTGLAALTTGLAQRWAAPRGFTVEPRMVLGNFLYTNMPMVADLENNLETFSGNDLVAAIAGDEQARQALAARIVDPAPNQPDLDLPESEFLVLDADASQNRAINRVLAGSSEVIWGPPGTGKSQTIGNLIAALTALGKRVLFVAEKRAAIDVVLARLEQVGLADLVLDAHGGISSKREFAQSMADSVRSIKTVQATDHSALHSGLAERRQQLIDHDTTMHQMRGPWNLTLYEVQAAILGGSGEVLGPAVIPSEKARNISREMMTQLMQDVREWVDLGGPSLDREYPEWARSSISTLEEAREALNLVRDLATSRFQTVRSLVYESLNEVGLALPTTVPEWAARLRWMEEVGHVLDRFQPGVYSLGHQSLIEALAPAHRWWAPIAAKLSPRYRSAIREVRSTLKTPAEMSGVEAVEILEVVAGQVHRWRQVGNSTGYPRVPEKLSEASEAMAFLEESLLRAENFFPSEDLLGKPDPGISNWLDRLASQGTVAANLCRIREINHQLVSSGFGELAGRVGNGVSAERVAEAMEQAWLRTVCEDMVFADPHMAGFHESVQSRRQNEFVELDRRHRDITPERIKRAAAEAAIQVMNAYPQETNLVNREAAKRTRHLPVRRLLQQAPHVLTAIRPCWAMSPLLVAELIPADANLFDVVIFDEASQIPPAEAIGVLARAPQAVIAGDDRQLPPTPFFTSRLADEEEGDDEVDGALITDIESILDVGKAMPIREELLQWHYRSRDERLISFSNQNIYQGALTTFPGIALKGPVSHHLVPFRPVQGRSTRSHPDEVERVVDMVIDHARHRSGQSLGVIAFGVHHADRIDDTLRMKLRDMGDDGLDAFFSEDAREKFFVKSIERVQGDERDIIILSVGYHKAGDGSLPYRFGPLNQEGGERRLNVAVTRARHELHLVSSFSHHDMDPGRSASRGVELLRKYLEFSASGGSDLGTTVSHEPLNGFELDVLNRLEEQGIPVTPQLGVGKYRLDFACAHPERKGLMVLAIEADGASYHSGHTARERDRLRQQNLEDKGWKFHRIWSTSWFRDRDREVRRALEAWKAACEEADSGQPAVPETLFQPSDDQAWVSPGSTTTVERGPRPRIIEGSPITEYSHRQLVELARWILSDTLLRTDDDLHRDMRRELGFRRGGSRINRALQLAIDEARRLPG